MWLVLHGRCLTGSLRSSDHGARQDALPSPRPFSQLSCLIVELPLPAAAHLDVAFWLQALAGCSVASHVCTPGGLCRYVNVL
uniref:Uncharacterized protein n=1 Tax=Aegilops tauschii subsp. strangulata TaxID=200361 RepID=A0A453IXV9_AEGTS